MGVTAENMRRFIEVPIQLLDIEGEGFHIMVRGMIHDKEASFLIDTGASRSVFDPKTITAFIEDIQFEKKEGLSAGVGSSDLESATFVIDRLGIGALEITDYEGVALDLENIHEMYGKLGLPHIDGIIGGDLLRRHKAVINYRSRKLRLTP
ncbi:MAG: aspartyl protease family protein [Bacteroidales bacterium]|nr:aspartyl protease family protein [Bacteroidales bacterium]